MGNWYANVTLTGPLQNEIVEGLISSGIRAAVSPTDGKVTIVAPDIDMKIPNAITNVAIRISKDLDCLALALAVYDDSVLWYGLYRSGALLDEYDSAPNFFNLRSTELTPPEGGDAFKLCEAFGVPERASEVGEILHTDPNVLPPEDLLDVEIGSEDFLRIIQERQNSHYVFEFQRHQALVSALGISSYSVFFDHKGLREGEIPDGLDTQLLIWTP